MSCNLVYPAWPFEGCFVACNKPTRTAGAPIDGGYIYSDVTWRDVTVLHDVAVSLLHWRTQTETSWCFMCFSVYSSSASSLGLSLNHCTDRHFIIAICPRFQLHEIKYVASQNSWTCYGVYLLSQYDEFTDDFNSLFNTLVFSTKLFSFRSSSFVGLFLILNSFPHYTYHKDDYRPMLAVHHTPSICLV